MNDKRNIEKVSRTAFDNFKMDAPDNAWAKLDADLDKKQAAVFKLRANRFKRLSIVLLLIIFSFTAWQFLISTSGAKKLSRIQVENKTSANKLSSNNFEPKNNSNSNISSGNLISSKNVNGTVSKNSVSDKNDFNKSKNLQLTTKVNSIINEKGKLQAGKEKQNDISNVLNIPTVKNENIKESNSPIPNSISNEVVSVTNDSIQTNEAAQNILAKNSIESRLLQSIDTNTSELGSFIKNDSMIRNNIQTTSRLSVAVFYSPNQSQSILKDNTNNNFDDVAMYNNRENSKFSFTTGLNFKYDLNKKWTLLTGASFSTISKSCTIQTMYAATNARNEIHFLLPTSNGIIEMPNDVSHANLKAGDSLTATAVCNQLIKFINVPIMIGFQIPKKKITWYANAGVSANFIIQEKAKIKMNNSETTIMNHVSGLKKMNFGFLIGTGVQYNLFDNFGIFIEPMLRGSFTSITRSTAVNSYPYSLGLNLGVSLHF